MWLCVGNYVSEINAVKQFCFVFCYDSVMVEEVAYCEVIVIFQSDFDNVPNFQQSYIFFTVSCAIYGEPEL